MLRLCRWRGCQGVFFFHWQGQLTLLQHLPSWLHPVWIISCRYSFHSWASQDFSGQLTSLQLNGWLAESRLIVSEIAFWLLSLYSPNKANLLYQGSWLEYIGMMIGQDLPYLLRCAWRFHMRSIGCKILRQRIWVSRKLRWTGFRWWRLCPGFTELRQRVTAQIWDPIASKVLVAVCPRWKSSETISWTNTRIWRYCNASSVEMVWICLDEGPQRYTKMRMIHHLYLLHDVRPSLHLHLLQLVQLSNSLDPDDGDTRRHGGCLRCLWAEDATARHGRNGLEGHSGEEAKAPRRPGKCWRSQKVIEHLEKMT